MEFIGKIRESASYILEKTKYKPTIGLILGSGLGSIGDKLEGSEKYRYEDIPHFPVSTVEGHAGQLVIGKLEGKTVVAMQGRFHYYEGYSMLQVTFAVRIMKMLGVEKLLVTNAAGGINTEFSPGDLMLITDHINFSGINPLIGENLNEFGVRFPDMSQAYDQGLLTLSENIALQKNIGVKKGVYVCVTGPSYETPAEIRMFRMMGADAVGMSTIPEVIVANHSGMRVIGISCITNMAAGILDQPLNHEEVMQTSSIAKEKFILLVRGIISQI